MAHPNLREGDGLDGDEHGDRALDSERHLDGVRARVRVKVPHRIAALTQPPHPPSSAPLHALTPVTARFCLSERDGFGLGFGEVKSWASD